MIDFNTACEIAYEYFVSDGMKGLCRVKEAPEAWIISGGEPGVVMYGGKSVIIYKNDGLLINFTPEIELLKMMKVAKEIPFPDKYKYRD